MVNESAVFEQLKFLLYVVFKIYAKFDRLYLQTEETELTSVKVYIALFDSLSDHSNCLMNDPGKLPELIFSCKNVNALKSMGKYFCGNAFGPGCTNEDTRLACYLGPR